MANPTLTTGDALLAGIIDHPDDDVRRLVYADWLEDRDAPGDRERAELIRVQCELARMPPLQPRWDYYQDNCRCERCDASRPTPRRLELESRERELLNVVGPLVPLRVPRQLPG